MLPKIPPQFICPISGRIMHNPVFVPTDGVVCDKRAFMEYCSKEGKTPRGSNLVDGAIPEVMENNALKRQINEFLFSLADEMLELQERERKVLSKAPAGANGKAPRMLWLSRKRGDTIGGMGGRSEAAAQYLDEYARSVDAQKQELIGALAAWKPAEEVKECISRSAIDNITLENVVVALAWADLLNRSLVLQPYPNIRVLNLFACQMGPENMVDLSSVIHNLPRLEILMLDRNNMCDVGAKAIAGKLSFFANLWQLYVRENNIGINGMKELVRECTQIDGKRKAQGDQTKFEVDISGNPVDSGELQAYAASLKGGR